VLSTLLVSVISAGILFGSSVRQRVRDILDLYVFNGDALQHIAPLWFLWDRGDGSQADLVSNYYLDAILPLFFKAIYGLAVLVASPVVASKIATVTLSVVFIIATSLTSYRLAGPVASYLSFLFASGGVLKNVYFMGGIQRGFGICLMALALYFVVSGNILAITVLCVLAAGLYPAATVLLLIYLCIVLLLPPSYRGSAAAWSLQRRLATCIAVAAASVVVMVPQIRGGAKYGERLSIESEHEFAEWGPLGRYTQGDRGVPVSFISRSLQVIASGLSASKLREENKGNTGDAAYQNDSLEVSPSQAIAIVGFLSACCGFWILRRRSWHPSAPSSRVMLLIVSAALAYLCATILFPLLYIPSRYIALGFIPVVPVVFPSLWCAALHALLPNWHPNLLRSCTAAVVGISAFTLLGWTDTTFKHLPNASGYRPLFKYIRSLPPDTLIATWPRGIGNMVPLFTGRSVLLFEEGHQVFHRDFTLEARRRVDALVRLYSATDSAPVEVLRRDYGVTHILLDTRHLAKPPSYFEPFTTALASARAANPPSAELYLAHLAQTNTVLSHGPFAVIDIRNLPG
jgi:hypothetical protein